MAPEQNAAGAYLLDLRRVAEEYVDGFSRYNGGWIRKIDRIDKSKTNGYSLIGEFCRDGLQWMAPGVYLDCSRGGRRKYQRMIYTVFVLHEDGTVTAYNDDAVVSDVGQGGDRFVRLWPAVERALEEVASVDNKLAALRARRAELLAELAQIEEEIMELENKEVA